MAVPALKRNRAAVSYKEPSTDEDLSGDDSEAYSPAKRTGRPQRRSARHDGQQTKTDGDGQQLASSNEHTESPRSRRKRKRVSYRESSSVESSDIEVEEETEHVSPVRERSQPGRGRRPAKNPKAISRTSRPNKQLGAPLKRTAKPAARPVTKVPSDGKIPPWSTLPYHVLLDIFTYAAQPLHDDNFLPTPAISWLAKVARMCSAFTAPALTALYQNPPIFATKSKRKELVQHLIAPPANAHENYVVMPKRLELDATRMAHLTDPTHSTSDLAALILALKTLREIDIFDPFDRPPYRPRLKRIRRWYYPNELFDALRQSELRIRSWRWNSTFLSHDLLWMKDMHSENVFCNLQELVFTKFSLDPSDEARDFDEDIANSTPTKEELLASALAVLPRLKALTFETSTVVNARLLPLLPQNLVSLKFINCEELRSDMLRALLVTHGRHLEELVMNHNRSLDISFLVDLKTSCPRLESLTMDLNYYSTLALSDDSNPNYEELLGEGEIPSWPSTLRVIDIEYLRNWTVVAAKGFFKSLIQSARELPQLRELTILAMVDIDWRERAEFRREWTARFQDVFLRKPSSPNPHLASLRAFREWKVSEQLVEEKVDSFIEEERKKEFVDDDSDIPLRLLRPIQKNSKEKWGTRRLRTRAQSGDDMTESPEDDLGELYIQGRCETVVFRVDNIRPREEKFSENDFLDSEVSGDEDWIE